MSKLLCNFGAEYSQKDNPEQNLQVIDVNTLICFIFYEYSPLETTFIRYLM